MKYFTPELYLRLSSKNRTVVEKAHNDWEEAIQGYAEQLNRIAPKLPASTLTLAKSLCLHDYDYLGLNMPQAPDLNNSVAALVTRHNRSLVVLVYLLAEDPLIQEVDGPWPFSKEKVHWLYDEFDLRADGTQQHEVLLSNGRILTLRFEVVQELKHEMHPAPVAVSA